MKKKLLLLLFTILVVNFGWAQSKVEKVDSSQIPRKFSISKSPLIPDFPDKERSINELYEKLQGITDLNKPIDIGVGLKINVDFDTLTEIVSDGKVFKEVEINSPNSNTMSVNFLEIELAESAELFIINDEESYILGPITREDVSKSKNFNPGYIPGDKIRILLSESLVESGKSKLIVSKIGHIIYDFFGVSKFQQSRIEGVNCYGAGCAATCLENIICHSSFSTEARAVALITYDDPLDEFTTISLRGTGYLVNNGAQDKRALFLAANHTFGGLMLPDLMFIFHYQSPQCSPSTNGTQAYYVTGANSLANDGANNDLRLLELMSNPGTSRVFTGNPVSYLGWSIIDEPITAITGIHHPKGDVKKYLAGGTATPIIEPGEVYGVWSYSTTNGFPEPVSSGSPTLNQSKRVIGSLRSGSGVPNCSNFEDFDIYSVRLSRSWGPFCQYLDPNNEGIVAINTYSGSPATEIYSTVIGPSLVCSSSTYTLQNAPLDLAVNWTIVEGASLLSSASSGSGKDAIVSISSTSISGQVKIRFSVSGLCSTKTYDKTFRVGKPQAAGSITGGTYVYTNHILTYSIPAVPGATSYNWQLPSGWTGGGTGLGNSIVVTVGTLSGNVTVTPVNSCAQGQSSSLDVTVNNCPTCREINISPNPASESISIFPNNNKFDGHENFDIHGYSIYDLNGKLLKNSDQKIVGSPKRIDVKDLPKGMYIIHIILNEGVVSQKILVDR